MGEIFAIMYVSDKGLRSKIYKELKKTQNPSKIPKIQLKMGSGTV